MKIRIRKYTKEKRILTKYYMKYLLILPLFISSCMHYEAAYVKTYNSQCVDSFNQMKPPIILSNIIDYGDGLDGVILRDGYDINHTFGGLSTFANWLANEYAIGDTVVKPYWEE